MVAEALAGTILPLRALVAAKWQLELAGAVATSLLAMRPQNGLTCSARLPLSQLLSFGFKQLACKEQRPIRYHPLLAVWLLGARSQAKVALHDGLPLVPLMMKAVKARKTRIVERMTLSKTASVGSSARASSASWAELGPPPLGVPPLWPLMCWAHWRWLPLATTLVRWVGVLDPTKAPPSTP